MEIGCFLIYVPLSSSLPLPPSLLCLPLLFLPLPLLPPSPPPPPSLSSFPPSLPLLFPHISCKLLSAEPSVHPPPGALADEGAEGGPGREGTCRVPDPVCSFTDRQVGVFLSSTFSTHPHFGYFFSQLVFHYLKFLFLFVS